MNHVRRPLALAACVFLAAVFFALLCSGGLYGEALPGEGERVLTGKLVRREEKETFHGELLPVYYVTDEARRGALVQCELYASPDETPCIGARVSLRGRAVTFSAPTNPGEFDRQKYYAVMRISYRLKEAHLISFDTGYDPYREGLTRLREHAGRLLTSALPPAEAGVLRAVLLGDKSGMEDHVRDLYAASGILHILAVSGLHVSFLGGMLYRFLLRLIPVRFGRARLAAAGVVVFVMISYGLFTGMSASASRAVIMFVLRVVADRLKRTYDIVTALAVAAALLVMEQPLYLLYSGFQFSFLAVLGISVLFPALSGRADPLQQMMLRESRVRRHLYALRQAFLSSLSVTLMTLPVQLCHQYTAPVYAALLNMIVIPFMSVLFPAGLLVLAFGWSEASLLPAAVCRGVLHLYEGLCEVTRTLPLATWYAGRVRPWQIVMYYALLCVLMYYCGLADRKMSVNVISFRYERYKRWTVTILLLAAGIALMGWRVPPCLQITMLDVGQGDGIVVQHRDGVRTYRFLIDGGSTTKSAVGSYQILPYLKHEGIGALDAVLISHEDADHISGVLELLTEAAAGGIRVEHLFLPEAGGEIQEGYVQLLQAAEKADVSVHVLHAGQRMAFGEVALDCLAPVADGAAVRSGEPNARSMVLRLRYGAFSALFTGDVEGEGLAELTQTLRGMEEKGADVDLLKVAHHGSRGATDEDFLALTRPEVALISCGRDNRYGHPHAEVLQLLEDAYAQTFITATSGAVTVRVTRDGARMEVEEFLR